MFALAGLVVSLALPTFAQEQSAINPETRQQIEAAHIKFEEAYNRHDAADVAALFTQDAVEVLAIMNLGKILSV